jgi:hypothetical protein
VANEEPLNPPKQWKQLSHALSHYFPSKLQQVNKLAIQLRGIPSTKRTR